MGSKKYDHRYLELAKFFSTWSKDPSTQIGAVAIGEKGQVLAQGYNGFPRKVDETEERYQNRETKYKYVVHAEMNCIYNATYNGISLQDSTFYIHGLPVCSECAKGIIQVGVKSVVWRAIDDIPPQWLESNMLTEELFNEAGVEYVQI